jgi:signal transduction histidine kinase
MLFGIKLKNKAFSKIFAYIFFILGTLLFLIIFYYYNESAKRVNLKSSSIIPQLYSQHFYYSNYETYESKFYHHYLKKIINDIPNPIIITDSLFKPLKWKNISIRDSVSFKELKKREKRALRRKVELFKRTANVIPIKIYLSESDSIKGYALFEEDKSFRLLNYIPLFQFFLLIVFISLGIYVLFIIKNNEKNNLWIGLAKETAHQFGTPITSLLGWVEILNLQKTEYSADEFQQALNNIQTDVLILQKIANRFSKIGSSNKFESHKLDRLLLDSIDYFKVRLPHFNNQITIHFINELPNLIMYIDGELFQWAFENVLKNSIDSMQKKGGDIFITLTGKRKNISIIVMDEGCGISKQISAKRIFDPGVTSKKRGWGLGLSLSKRIINDYFHGTIRVLYTKVGEGTSIEIAIPSDTVIDKD